MSNDHNLKLNKMKKIIFLAIVTVMLNFSTFGQIGMDSNGKVGIGCTPNSSYNLTTNGYSYFSGNIGIGVPPNSTYKLKTPNTSQSFFGRVNISYAQTSPALQVHAITTAPAVYIYGNSLGYLLYVNGNAYSSGSWISSDIKLKKNVNDLDGAEMINKIMNINGKSYEFKNKKELEDVYRNNKCDSIYKVPNLSKGKQLGLIAQEVEKVFPELVKLDSTTNLKAMNYNGMIPILLQAIKEQQVIIANLQSEFQELKGSSENTTLKSSTIATEYPDLQKNTISELYQNTPNPFSQSTTIKYYLKTNIQKATIYIYDMNGTQLKSIELHKTGKGSVQINGGEFHAGIYLYALIADGKVIDTKKMVLTD